MADPVSMQDHDLLIQLHTKTDTVLNELKVVKELEYRVRTVEQEGSRRSEKVASIARDVDALQRSQVNSARIDAIAADVADLKKKGYIFDGLNAAGAAIAIIVAWFKN